MKFGARPPKRLKAWERDLNGNVVENPFLVRLEVEGWWRPRKYIEYIWLYLGANDLRVGVESQVGTRFYRDDGYLVGATHGHPTLAFDAPNASAVCGGELYWHDFRWCINNHSGRYSRGMRRVPSMATLFEVKGLFARLAGLVVILHDLKHY